MSFYRFNVLASTALFAVLLSGGPARSQPAALKETIQKSEEVLSAEELAILAEEAYEEVRTGASRKVKKGKSTSVNRWPSPAVIKRESSPSEVNRFRNNIGSEVKKPVSDQDKIPGGSLGERQSSLTADNLEKQEKHASSLGVSTVTHSEASSAHLGSSVEPTTLPITPLQQIADEFANSVSGTHSNSSTHNDSAVKQAAQKAAEQAAERKAAEQAAQKAVEQAAEQPAQKEAERKEFEQAAYDTSSETSKSVSRDDHEDRVAAWDQWYTQEREAERKAAGTQGEALIETLGGRQASLTAENLEEQEKHAPSLGASTVTHSEASSAYSESGRDSSHETSDNSSFHSVQSDGSGAQVEPDSAYSESGRDSSHETSDNSSFHSVQSDGSGAQVEPDMENAMFAHLPTPQDQNKYNKADYDVFKTKFEELKKTMESRKDFSATEKAKHVVAMQQLHQEFRHVVDKNSSFGWAWTKSRVEKEIEKTAKKAGFVSSKHAADVVRSGDTVETHIQHHFDAKDSGADSSQYKKTIEAAKDRDAQFQKDLLDRMKDKYKNSKELIDSYEPLIGGNGSDDNRDEVHEDIQKHLNILKNNVSKKHFEKNKHEVVAHQKAKFTPQVAKVMTHEEIKLEAKRLVDAASGSTNKEPWRWTSTYENLKKDVFGEKSEVSDSVKAEVAAMIKAGYDSINENSGSYKAGALYNGITRASSSTLASDKHGDLLASVGLDQDSGDGQHKVSVALTQASTKVIQAHHDALNQDQIAADHHEKASVKAVEEQYGHLQQAAAKVAEYHAFAGDSDVHAETIKQHVDMHMALAETKDVTHTELKESAAKIKKLAKDHAIPHAETFAAQAEHHAAAKEQHAEAIHAHDVAGEKVKTHASLAKNLNLTHEPVVHTPVGHQGHTQKN